MTFVEGTKRDAQRELARLVHKLNTGGYVEQSKMTIENTSTNGWRTILQGMQVLRQASLTKHFERPYRNSAKGLSERSRQQCLQNVCKRCLAFERTPEHP